MYINLVSAKSHFWSRIQGNLPPTCHMNHYAGLLFFTPVCSFWGLAPCLTFSGSCSAYRQNGKWHLPSRLWHPFSYFSPLHFCEECSDSRWQQDEASWTEFSVIFAGNQREDFSQQTLMGKKQLNKVIASVLFYAFSRISRASWRDVISACRFSDRSLKVTSSVTHFFSKTFA